MLQRPPPSSGAALMATLKFDGPPEEGISLGCTRDGSAAWLPRAKTTPVEKVSPCIMTIRSCFFACHSCRNSCRNGCHSGLFCSRVAQQMQIAIIQPLQRQTQLPRVTAWAELECTSSAERTEARTHNATTMNETLHCLWGVPAT